MIPDKYVVVWYDGRSFETVDTASGDFVVRTREEAVKELGEDRIVESYRDIDRLINFPNAPFALGWDVMDEIFGVQI